MSSTQKQALLYQVFIQETYKDGAKRVYNKGAVTLMRSVLLMESAGYLTKDLRNKNVAFIKKQINIAFDYIIKKEKIDISDVNCIIGLKDQLKNAQSASELVDIVEQGLALIDNEK